MAFGQDFLNSFFGNDYLKDYRHASKTFRTNGYQNSPRLKFLFHVYFNLNTTEIPQLRTIFNSSDQSTIGLLVKNVELPRYKIDVETLNQYNRKRLVQSKINYQPVKTIFHDDGSDLIRTLWYNYYSYYYKDPSQPYRGSPVTNGSMGPLATQQAGFDYNTRDIYDADRQVNDWGFIGESYNDGTNSRGGKPPFFKDISIYGFNQHKFVEYTLINPMITEWSHDTYDYYEETGVMENQVTIEYETVKYYSGALGNSNPDTNVQGFGAPGVYDTDVSPLSRPGSTNTVLGQGGVLDTGIGIVNDLEKGTVGGLIGAVQKAGTVYNTTKNTDLGDVLRTEILRGAQDVLRNDLNGINSQPNGPGALLNNILNTPIFPTPKK